MLQPIVVKYIFTVLIFCGLMQQLTAQSAALSSITTGDLYRHLSFIAADSLQGRGLNTSVHGLEITAGYLKKQAEAMGLKPAFDNYMQQFGLIKSQKASGKYSFKLYSKNENPVYTADSVTKLQHNNEHIVEYVQVKNIAGIITGSHPQLKEECVVFIAHYDHLGMDNNGQVYNGADDNGSGIVTLLEVAEAFSQLPEKPKRSIVFLWVSAEEVGLLGSQFYTQHPAFLLEKTVACINPDMVGRVYQPRDSVWQNSPKLVKDSDGIYTLANSFSPSLQAITDSFCTELGLIPDKSLPQCFLHSSDHYHFHSRGVPILNLSTGYHADFHKVSD
ncbi:MAG: M20/M25/M40 family metallo-hydrolase, partial [Prolixibacteraceae bacterium]